MYIYIYIYIPKNLRLATLACRFDGKVCSHHACAHKLKKKWFVELFFFQFLCAGVGELTKTWCPGGAQEVPGRCPRNAFRMFFGRPAAGSARIKKKWQIRARLSDFFGQNGQITTSF